MSDALKQLTTTVAEFLNRNFDDCLTANLSGGPEDDAPNIADFVSRAWIGALIGQAVSLLTAGDRDSETARVCREIGEVIERYDPKMEAKKQHVMFIRDEELN